MATRHVTAANVVASIKAVLAEARAIPASELVAHRSSPAGISLQVFFDDAKLAEAYSSRLVGNSCGSAREEYQVFVLSGPSLPGGLPEWLDRRCSAKSFDTILRNAGIRATFPYQPCSWRVLDTSTNTAMQLVNGPEKLPIWDISAPLRQFLHWILPRYDLRMTHAATLGRASHGLLLLGEAGTGKSGTILAGLASGLQTAGDDSVGLGLADGPYAKSLFRLVRQDREGVARVPGLLDHLADYPENWRGKLEFDPDRFFPGCFLSEMRLGAVLLPRITGSLETRLVNVSTGEAMRALMRANFHLFSGDRDEWMAHFASLLRQLPCYRIELSTDARRNGEFLARFVDHL